MTTYNTYQEAKIANPNSNIIQSNSIGRLFKALGNGVFIGWNICNPADYCMTVEKFLADGYKFELGDACLDDDGEVVNIDVEYHTWDKPDERDSSRYILRAEALEDIPTETPEEKEVLDGIESAVEVEWKSGDECVIRNDNDRYSIYDVHKKHVGNVGIVRSVFKTTNGTEIAAVQADNGDCVCWRVDMLKKPETPQQREDRERLEAAYDLYCEWAQGKNHKPFCEFKAADATLAMWLRVVDKTNYRKEKSHGAN